MRFPNLENRKMLMKQLEKPLKNLFTYRIYDKKTSVSINEARYKVFLKKKEMPDPKILPPSQDALKMHITRADFQAIEWKNALSHLFFIYLSIYLKLTIIKKILYTKIHIK